MNFQEKREDRLFVFLLYRCYFDINADVGKWNRKRKKEYSIKFILQVSSILDIIYIYRKTK